MNPNCLFVRILFESLIMDSNILQAILERLIGLILHAVLTSFVLVDCTD